MTTTGLLVLLGMLVATGCGAPPTDPGGADGTADLIEASTCVPAGPAPPADPAVSSDHARVTVQIAPTALVRVDDDGRVVAAWTNTGCAPRPADDVYIEGPDGAIRRSGAAAVTGRPWIGDFRNPGVYVAQTPNG